MRLRHFLSLLWDPGALAFHLAFVLTTIVCQNFGRRETPPPPGLTFLLDTCASPAPPDLTCHATSRSLASSEGGGPSNKPATLGGEVEVSVAALIERIDG